jgi:hypothetical protein
LGRRLIVYDLCTRHARLVRMGFLYSFVSAGVFGFGLVALYMNLRSTKALLNKALECLGHARGKQVALGAKKTDRF